MAVPGIFHLELDEPSTTTEAKFWPGGIPSFIKSPTENVTVKSWEFNPIVKGWYRFVRENWIQIEASSNNEYDDPKFQQRRSLIEKWVLADQEYRDSYTNQASDSDDQFSKEELISFGCYCYTHGPPWDLYLTADAPIGSTNWALWLKILLLFNDYNHTWGHIALETFTIIPKKDDPVSLDNIKRYTGLETADFGIVGFNNAGEAVYNYYQSAIILVDDYALNTGLVLILFFHTNGTAREGCRIRATNFFSLFVPYTGLGKRLEDLMVWYGHRQDPLDERISIDNEPLDMKMPLLDILLTESEELDVDDEEVEIGLNELAPGYLAAERAGGGLAKDFDLVGSGFYPE